jgi:hypothetical protein
MADRIVIQGTAQELRALVREAVEVGVALTEPEHLAVEAVFLRLARKHRGALRPAEALTHLQLAQRILEVLLVAPGDLPPHETRWHWHLRHAIEALSPSEEVARG